LVRKAYLTRQASCCLCHIPWKLPPAECGAQARVHLFRLLQRLATQPGKGLDQALIQLADQADKVIADSPEANILPHIGTYRCVAGFDPTADCCSARSLGAVLEGVG
jgi:hypothetical protein